MAMTRWFFSFQFRLVAGFVLALGVLLGSASLAIGLAAEREVERFRQEVEEARAERIRQVVARFYSTRRGWMEVRPALEQVSDLYGWRVVVSDNEGKVVADSHERFGHRLGQGVGRRNFAFQVESDGKKVGSVIMVPSDAVPVMAAEPPLSQLTSALDRSLLWTGLAAAGAGTLLASLLSRRLLAPVRSLTQAARRLGRGDFSTRVPALASGEMGELGRTFNSMAEGLEQADRQRRSMMADVAHELRTPLSNIQGYLEAVKDGLLEADTATVDTIYQQVLHLRDLVEDPVRWKRCSADRCRGCGQGLRPKGLRCSWSFLLNCRWWRWTGLASPKWWETSWRTPFSTHPRAAG